MVFAQRYAAYIRYDGALITREVALQANRVWHAQTMALPTNAAAPSADPAAAAYSGNSSNNPNAANEIMNGQIPHQQKSVFTRSLTAAYREQ